MDEGVEGGDDREGEEGNVPADDEHHPQTDEGADEAQPHRVEAERRPPACEEGRRDDGREDARMDGKTRGRMGRR